MSSCAYALFRVCKNARCYRDTGNRAIRTLEGTDPILDGRYWTRKDSIAKCAVAAMRKGYSMFAVQHGGWCAASDTAPQTFNKYGKSTACGGDGEGGGWANQVYLMSQYSLCVPYSDNLQVKVHVTSGFFFTFTRNFVAPLLIKLHKTLRTAPFSEANKPRHKKN